MKLLDFLDRLSARRHERAMTHPARPVDTRLLVGTLFFVGYYAMVVAIMRTRDLPADNVTLVKDAMLVLGPIVGMIAQALFRTDVRDELQTQNTGEGFRALRASAEATKEAAGTTPPAPPSSTDAADYVAGAAHDAAEEIKGNG